MPPDDAPHLARLPAPEVAARLAAGHAVVLPMGSLETHGPALPMGDFLLAERIAARIAGAAGEALLAPVLPFGGADFFAGVPGAVALSPPTLARVVEEVLEALAEGGARRILVVNGHGGSIPAIAQAQRALRDRRDLLVPALHLWREAGALLAGQGGHPGARGHGGDPVASAALHLAPDLCRPATFTPRAAPGRLLGQPVSGFGSLRLEGVAFDVPTRVGEAAAGGIEAEDPARASAALGERIVGRLVEAGAAMLRAMRDQA